MNCNIWAKTILQTSYATAVVFFLAAFLSVAGMPVFASHLFNLQGFAILFLFILFNIFIVLNWK